MTEVARIGMKVTQAAAAVPAMLACEFGAKVSNCVCQVTHFHDFAMGWHGGQCTLYEQRTPGQQRRFAPGTAQAGSGLTLFPEPFAAVFVSK